MATDANDKTHGSDQMVIVDARTLLSRAGQGPTRHPVQRAYRGRRRALVTQPSCVNHTKARSCQMANTGEFLKQHPMCCFCGGQTPASEIDHQPARIIFPDKHRPKGLEFAACADCNRQTSADEALLAFVCRFAGSHRTNAARDFNRLKDIVGSVNQSFPGLRQKMHGQRLWAMERGVWVRVGAIDVNQPEVNLGLCRIAAKLALAIYYESRSSPASKDCRINTQWTHCENAGAFNHVQNIIQAIPSQAILQMGKWNTQDSFFLKYHYEDGLLFSAAIFHQSVALIAQLREPGRPHHEQKWQFIMSPLPGTGITVLSV